MTIKNKRRLAPNIKNEERDLKVLRTEGQFVLIQLGKHIAEWRKLAV